MVGSVVGLALLIGAGILAFFVIRKIRAPPVVEMNVLGIAPRADQRQEIELHPVEIRN